MRKVDLCSFFINEKISSKSTVHVTAYNVILLHGCERKQNSYLAQVFLYRIRVEG